MLDATAMPTPISYTFLPTWIRGRLSAYEIAVLFVLQSYYPKTSVSLKEIADGARICIRTASRVLASLERQGLLRRERRSDASGAQQTNSYQLLIWREPEAVK